MNNLKEYILQCRKAIEIQRLHKPAIGDRYFCACNACGDHSTIYHIHDYDMDSINKRDLTNVYEPYAKLVRDADTCTFHAFYNERTPEYLSYIWLPRQDRLQKMIELPKHRDKAGLATYFSLWLNKNIDFWKFGWSMEQLWLAFVMKEEFNKIWNDENWIDNIK